MYIEKDRKIQSTERGGWLKKVKMAFREGSLHESFHRERERDVISPSTTSLLLLQALRILKQQRVGDWDVVFFIVVFRLPIQSGLRCRGRYQKFRIRRFGYDNLSR